jgi:LmbE family N-acetylglucosaminyl deacetylase
VSARRIARRLEEEVSTRARRRAARSLTTAVRHDPAAPALLLSPHLDDAVVSCWSVVADVADVTVVNVFAGVPPAGAASGWDLLCRATDRAALMHRRIAEDQDALLLAGRTPVNLDFLADPYRTPRQAPDVKRLDAALAAVAPAASVVLAPAAIGTVHPDHLLVRDHALALAAAGIPVELYADLPYAAVYGWPDWVTGDAPDPHLDPEAYWRGGRADLPDLLVRDRARVVHLVEDAAHAKLTAMQAYRTQFAMLDRGPVGQLSNPSVHGFEVRWPVGT